MGARVGLDRCGKSRPYRDSIPGPSRPYSVAILTELPGPCRIIVLVPNFTNFVLYESKILISVLNEGDEQTNTNSWLRDIRKNVLFRDAVTV